MRVSELVQKCKFYIVIVHSIAPVRHGSKIGMRFATIGDVLLDNELVEALVAHECLEHARHGISKRRVGLDARCHDLCDEE